MTSDEKQTRYWREKLGESFRVLSIGMSEPIISDDANHVRPEQSSVTDTKSARIPLSDTRCDTESLNTEGIVGLHPRYEKTCVPDARGVASKRS